MEKKISVLDFKKKKADRKKITMLTAYDYQMARIIDSSEADAVLVGDSLGMVMLGYDSTLRVTMREMIHHARAVRRGVKRAFLAVDMPFMSYQASREDAVRNAGRLVKETGCDAVKLEGGAEVSDKVSAIIDAGIPVLGHIGLTPQSVSKLGGYRVQGREKRSAKKLIEDAASLEKAGCFSLILECVPSDLAKEITERSHIPAIGIGAGRYCDGQVLVTNDIIGCFEGFLPKFAKKYAEAGSLIKRAVSSFVEEVDSGTFPDDEHSYS